MNGNRSVLRAIDILNLLSQEQDGMTLKEIMDALQIPKTSTYDILKALVAQNMVVEDRSDSVYYRIGLKAFQIGNAYLSNADLINRAKPYVKVLGETLGKTTFIAVLDHTEVTYIYKYEPKRAILTSSNIGTKNPVHCTSLGKAILSGMTQDNLMKTIKNITYDLRTDRTIRSETQLLANIDETRARGYAIDDREIEDHTLCMGAPIFNHEGNVIAGISFSGLYKDDMDIAFEGTEVKKAASKISRSMGYLGDYYE